MQVNNNWEQHQDVIDFLASNNPTTNLMARAYYARDTGMELDFNNIVTKTFNKLGYTPEGINRFIKNGFSSYINNLTRQFLENPNYNLLDERTISQLYEVYIESNRPEMEYRTQRYNFLSNFVNNNDHLGFYSNMTENELVYIGW